MYNLYASVYARALLTSVALRLHRVGHEHQDARANQTIEIYISSPLI
jgi:hypothetical protein